MARDLQVICYGMYIDQGKYLPLVACVKTSNHHVLFELAFGCVISHSSKSAFTFSTPQHIAVLFKQTERVFLVVVFCELAPVASVAVRCTEFQSPFTNR